MVAALSLKECLTYYYSGRKLKSQCFVDFESNSLWNVDICCGKLIFERENDVNESNGVDMGFCRFWISGMGFCRFWRSNGVDMRNFEILGLEHGEVGCCN